MKQIIPVLALAILMVGCATTQPKTTLQIALESIQFLVPEGVAMAAVEEPDAVPYMRAVAVAIDTVAASTNISPVALKAEIAKIPAAAGWKWTPLAVSGGVAIYSAFWSGQVASNSDTVAVLKAVASAMRQGLNMPPAAKRKLRRV